jgi:hypothetical protein
MGARMSEPLRLDMIARGSDEAVQTFLQEIKRQAEAGQIRIRLVDGAFVSIEIINKEATR